MKKRNGLFWLSLQNVLFYCLTACTEYEQVPRAADTGQSPLAARIGGREIRLEKIDNALQLALYDLAEMQYGLRVGKIYELADKKYHKQAVEILLPVPVPPRIELPGNSNLLRGNPKAPITISVFCSFQSPHCKSLQPVLRRLAEHYPGWTGQAHFDFPLKFHREGIPAAHAARCAAAQGAYSHYHDALYEQTPKLDGKLYAALAQRLQLDEVRFRQCLADADVRSKVLKDRAMAIDLGLNNVPVVLINGLYQKGPRTFEQYAYWVEGELRAMGVSPGAPYVWRDSGGVNDRNLPMTTLPLALVGVSASSVEENTKALIEVEQARTRYFTLGEQLLPNVSLLRLYDRFAVIDNRGSLERLPLRGEAGTDIPLTDSRPISEAARQRIEQPLGPGTRRLIEPSGVLTLGQEWLRKQLDQRELLEAKFTQAELALEGHHLLRLEGITDSEFFTGLGLQENDVLLRVNDSWVHSGQNTLWEALTSGRIVDVTLMRKGLPYRLQYVVEELGYFDEDAAQDED
ncbi:thioredoxin domain-containing protein [Microbulbifer sp. 2205BS26-8]|uniref:thioredoxin domain-containing protein n=1 Tax=Microbulbifer sp. 2205BS26-8 TaxID=3064386 RepID=UPI00273F1E8B|nr:thioredoxin domain-containing protein [Microbulbifer sp. 2205BS26-8]MDP5208373.1 thioredoxin domain-containing protein [Microbulbifer sp. 2205BS26-8]